MSSSVAAARRLLSSYDSGTLPLLDAWELLAGDRSASAKRSVIRVLDYIFTERLSTLGEAAGYETRALPHESGTQLLRAAFLEYVHFDWAPPRNGFQLIITARGVAYLER